MPNLKTVLTNEIKLHDYQGNTFSLSYGDSDINEGYSYANLKFLADLNKIDLVIDRRILNITADYLKLNDKDVWSETKQGPGTGMNSDMLDGFHYYDFKDRLGSNYFKHMFSLGGNSEKKYVKIASFISRRVGSPGAYPEDGDVDYDKLFTKIETDNRIEEFIVNTPIDLAAAGVFQSTGMTKEGIFNSCSRGTITVLNDNPSTLDFHIGVFYNPESSITNGIDATTKLFYISSHSNNIPSISNDTIEALNERIDLINQMSSLVSKVNPTDPIPDYTPPAPFAPITIPTDSYDEVIDTLRLYYIGSETEEIDGRDVVIHKYDLYMTIDETSEYHVSPYMSSGAIFYNYSTPIIEAQLPGGEYINPRSINDIRYAHKEHRHLEVEKKITDLINEIDAVWNSFDYFTLKNQGLINANKVMMTNEEGEIIPVNNTFVSSNSVSEAGSRVIVSNSSRELTESNITTTELNYLDNSKSNIQAQIDSINGSISNMLSSIRIIIEELEDLNIPNVSNFVEKTGDEMTGNLTLKNQARLYLNDDTEGEAYMYAHSTNYLFGITSQGTSIIRFPKAHNCVQFSKTSMLLDNTKLTINPTAPTSPSNGDIWIKNS